MASLSYPGTEAEQLLLAPQDLRTADPSFATEIYNGHFGSPAAWSSLARNRHSRSRRSEGWARELYGFGWLRHLRVAGSEAVARASQSPSAISLAAQDGARPRLAAEVVGREGDLLALSNSVVVLDAGNPKSYETFLHSLTAHLRYLSASYRDTRRRAAPRRPHGARLCRAVHRRAASGGGSLPEAVLYEL
jgi:uncharacterized heparinase superfamily protein